MRSHLANAAFSALLVSLLAGSAHAGVAPPPSASAPANELVVTVQFGGGGGAGVGRVRRPPSAGGGGRRDGFAPQVRRSDGPRTLTPRRRGGGDLFGSVRRGRPGGRIQGRPDDLPQIVRPARDGRWHHRRPRHVRRYIDGYGYGLYLPPILGYYGSYDDCEYFWRRWLATGNYIWRRRYDRCLDY